MSRAAAINDALRPAGRAMTVGTVGPADPDCPDCGRDVFACTCEPLGDASVADEVRAAIAESERKRAKAIADARVALGLAKDLRARVAELEEELAGRAADRHARAERAPTRAVDRSGDPLGDYLARLVIPAKRAYADAWVAHLRDGGPVPTVPEGVPWDAVDVERKVRRWARRGVLT